MAASTMMGIKKNTTWNFGLSRKFRKIYFWSKDRAFMQNKKIYNIHHIDLSLSRPRSLSYRNQSIDLQSKSMEWFLYDKDLRHERVKSI